MQSRDTHDGSHAADQFFPVFLDYGRSLYDERLYLGLVISDVQMPVMEGVDLLGFQGVSAAKPGAALPTHMPTSRGALSRACGGPVGLLQKDLNGGTDS